MKRITDEQLLGEKGITLIKRTVEEMGFTWHPSNQPVEAGIDGWVELRDATTGEVGNCWIAVQSRARSQVREDETTVKFNCSLKDVEYWLLGNAPVILIVSKPEEDIAWWVSVKDYFDGKDVQNDRTVCFDKKRDLFTGSTAEDWKALGTLYGAGVYFTPPKVKETLTSNLLRVSRFASTIFSADVEFDSGKDVHDELKKQLEYPPREWAFGKDKRIYSFHDLSESPWKHVCDTSTITESDAEEFAYSDDATKRNCFVQLLNGCFRQIMSTWRMHYSPEGDCHYFAADKTTITRKVSYKSRKVQTSKEVVKRYFNKKDNTRIAYYRHDALSHRFLRYGDAWYLAIEPTYVFTTDGKEPDPYREEHLAKIKTIEGDAAVSGRIVMLANVFRDREDMFHDLYDFLGLEGIESAEVCAGIDDAAWARIKSKKAEPQESSKVAKFGAGILD